MPVPMSIDLSSSVRHLPIGRATLSTSDLQFPPRKITGSESNEDESLREWERREKLNLEERRGGANPGVVQVRPSRSQRGSRHGGVAQLVEAHAGCHHAGVVHRDVKPTRRALSGGEGA